MFSASVIGEACSMHVCFVPRGLHCALTQQHCRDANRAQEEWFGNAASFQEKTGLFDPPPLLTNQQVAQICSKFASS